MNRNIRTIAGRILHRKGNSSTVVPNAIFHVAVQFVVAFCLILFSFTIWWVRYFYIGDETDRIILVNAPASFEEYAATSGLNPDKLTYRTWGATFDYATFNDWMKDEDAYLTVVFPENFEEVIYSEHQVPDILTFYRTNSLLYTEHKNSFVDVHLKNYENALKADLGITYDNSDTVTITSNGVVTAAEDIYSLRYFARSMVQTIVPLVIFIVILYISMSAGTNVIAGEKERGTFAAVLMTPVKRRDIVIGNVIGVTIKALIPALIFALVIFLLPVYTLMGGIYGLLNILLLTVSLALFVASVTILISVLNNSVVSAQTAFLPIFLVMVAVCVTCIQNVREISEFYYYLPVYGHFYGIGSGYTGNGSILRSLACVLVSGILSFVCIFVSEKLLHREQFTVSGDQITGKDIIRARKLIERQKNDYVSRPRAEIFGFRGTKRTSWPSFIIDQVIYPLAVLSVFQILALIPTVAVYMRRAEYSGLIYSLKDVKSVPEVIDKSFEVMAIFLGDPLFLILMSLGYIGIILTYIIRVRISERGLPSTLGLRRGNILKKYIMGLILGLILMGNVYILLIITGQLTPSIPTFTAGNIATILAGLLMWIPQGAAEEVMFRGFMLPRQGSRFGTGFALVFSSFLFALFHSMNAGFTPLAFINLFLIAFFFAILDLRAGHIWYSCAAHTMWNFLQGNVFGLQVSGNQGAATLLRANYSAGAKDIITGGAFGPEGGLAVTVVTVIAIIAVDYAGRSKRVSKII